jgi:thymidylate synthase (FAD)
MSHVTIEIDTSRGIAPQILRHRSFSFQEFSQRYQSVSDDGIVVYAARRQDLKNKQNSIDDLPENIKKEWEDRQLQNWKSSFEHYTWALDNGIAKESARFVLPLGSKTRLYMSGSVRSWLHYISVRADASTQKEHRDIALACKEALREYFPNLIVE